MQQQSEKRKIFGHHGVLPHKLHVKMDDIAMVLRSFNTSKGLCNVTRLQVTKLLQNFICATVQTGTAEARLAFIPGINLASIIINKSQG